MVLTAGADIVDLKNPVEGALGALPIPIVKAIVKTVANRAIVSATIGDQPMQPVLLVDKTREMLATGVDIIKVGFFGRTHHDTCLQALQLLAEEGVQLIAVLFADMLPNFDLLDQIAAAGFYGVMLDTAQKDGRHLLNHCSLERLDAFVSKARSLGLQVGLAGALSKREVQPLLSIKPSYLGFRSALCRQSERTAEVDTTRVAELVKMMHKQPQSEASSTFVNKASYALI